MQKTLSDEIVALLGVSESDDRMLDVFEKLGVDKDKLERDEDDGSFWVELEEEMGLELEFNSSLPERYRNPNHEGGQYLVDISFYENNTFLPYELQIGDSLEIVEKRLNRKANYISAEDNNILHWMHEGFTEVSIQFKDNTYEYIEYMSTNLYEEPTKESEEYFLPFKR